MHVAIKLSDVATALREAGTKIRTATREIRRREDEAASWIQRFIYHETEQRAQTRAAAYWDALFPGLTPEERARRRIDRMLTRATIAGVAAAAGATGAELLSLTTDGVGSVAAVPLGLASVGAEMVYTTALQIDLAFDLASIYGVPFARDDVGEISTLLALSLGVELVREPTRHDKPARADETKPWRIIRQMRRDDFAKQVAREIIQQSVLRNIIPVASVLVSAVWNQVMLRRYARHVHTTMRQRRAIVRACEKIQLGDQEHARMILDGAWLIATSDSDIGHQEALTLAKLIESLTLPENIEVHVASFTDDEEAWFERLVHLDPEAHDMLIAVLSLVAASDGHLSTPEWRFLRRVARTLNHDLDQGAVLQIVEGLQEGEFPVDVPSQVLVPA